jgi:hypothetical protein
LAPAILTSPSSLVAFGTIGVQVTAEPVPVTVTNPGTLSALTGLSAALDANGAAAGFGLSATTCPTSLAPGASCTVNVTFTPAMPGKLTGTLTLTSTNGGIATLALGGIGFDFRFAVQGSSTSTVIAGQTAYSTLTLISLGSASSGTGTPVSGPYSFQCANLPANAVCSFNPGQLPGLPANVTGNDILAITTAAPNPTPSMARKTGRATLLLLSALVLVPLRRRGRRILRLFSLLVLALALCTTVTSCASAGGSTGQLQRTGATPPGTYTVTVTATSIGVAHSLPIKLIVN